MCYVHGFVMKWDYLHCLIQPTCRIVQGIVTDAIACTLATTLLLTLLACLTVSWFSYKVRSSWLIKYFLKAFMFCSSSHFTDIFTDLCFLNISLLLITCRQEIRIQFYREACSHKVQVCGSFYINLVLYSYVFVATSMLNLPPCEIYCL